MTAAVTPGLFVVGTSLTGTAGATALNQMLAVMAELPGGSAIASLTIAGGIITPATMAVLVDTEGAAASDDLTNAYTTNMPSGRFLLLRSTASARNVVVKHLAGGDGQFNLADDADFTLDQADQAIMFFNVGSQWVEMFRQYGTAAADQRAYLGLTKGTGSTQIPTNADLAITKSFTSSEMSISSGMHSGDVAHGLGVLPKIIQLVAVCKTTEENFSVGDEVEPGGEIDDGSPSGATVGVNSTSMWVKCAVATNPIVAGRRAGAGGLVRLTNANWRLKMRAFA